MSLIKLNFFKATAIVALAIAKLGGTAKEIKELLCFSGTHKNFNVVLKFFVQRKHPCDVRSLGLSDNYDELYLVDKTKSKTLQESPV